MLKITVHEDQRTQHHQARRENRRALGRRTERTWTALAPLLGSKRLQLDLRGVVFADDNGRKLLREIYLKTRAGFLADSPLTKYFADDAMQPRT